MLRELRIENLLLIERAELDLGPGLTVLTGETGAGKTVLAHSLDLLTGGKARKGIVRSGQSEAWVEGVLDLPADWQESDRFADLRSRLPEDVSELTIARKVSAAGRTSAYIGGRSASAAELTEVTSDLISFFGQHEHRRLTLASAQLELVDSAGGEAGAELLARYGDAYRALGRARSELEALMDGSGLRDLDLLRFELDEIEAAGLSSGEEGELVTERDRLRHVESLRSAAAMVASGLTGETGEGGQGIVDSVSAMVDELGAAAGVDSELDAIRERCEGLSIELADIATELTGYLGRIEADPERLAQVEERLDLIGRLTRKHGGTEEAVLEHADLCRSRIASLEKGEVHEEELREEIGELEAVLSEAAGQLREYRVASAKRLSEFVSGDLGELAMDGAQLTVELIPEEGPTPHGTESVEFMLAPDAGAEPRPIREAASGGELSRVMLALAGAGQGSGSTLIFDEIDAGIGGNTATAVAARLREVAAGRQVLAITHLPQVAARADRHFAVTKLSGSEPVTATVERLEGEGLVGEIRRMLGATEGDEAATRHARELVASAA